MSPRVLVTGAHGYLGHRLGLELKERGMEAGALVRHANVDMPFADETLVADITRPITARTTRRYDVVVHLAAANDITSRDAEAALRITALGTRHVLDFCVANQIPRFLYVSTTQVYGKDHGLIDESTPAAPKNDYALTHLFAELYVRASSVRWAIARPANIFGAPASRAQERWTLVPSCFCLEAHESGTITLQSSGRQERDFLGATDVARLLLQMAERLDDLAGQTVNLTSGTSSTVLEMAERVAGRFTARTGRACLVETKSTAPQRGERLSMPSSLRERLGLVIERPQSLDEEIDRTFAVLEAS